MDIVKMKQEKRLSDKEDVKRFIISENYQKFTNLCNVAKKVREINGFI